MPDWRAYIRPHLAELRLSAVREHEIVDELAQHLDDRWRELIAGGASEADAMRLALAQLNSGVLEHSLASLRQAHAGPPDRDLLDTPGGSGRTWIERLAQDVRHGLRLLRKQRGLTAVAVLSLALAIGANAAVFALVDAVLLRPLPFPEPERLVLVWEASNAAPTLRGNVAPGNYRDWRTHNRSFDGVAAFGTIAVNLSGSGEPERLDGQAVTTNFFDVLGVHPMQGRAFVDADARDGVVPEVAIVSHRFWQAHMGSRRDFSGTALRLDGNRVTIVGVMPPGFQVIDATADVWVPAAPPPTDRGSHYLTVVARLRQGVTLEQAQTDVGLVTQRIARDFPSHADGLRAYVMPLREHLIGEARLTLQLLFAAVGTVLLIACANIANLLLARGSARRGEFATRTALGATRARVIRQLVTESVLLGVLGGALGLAVAPVSFALLKHLVPSSMLNSTSLSVSIPVVAFTFVISLLTAVTFGVAPALQVTRRSSFDVLREAGGRSAVAGRPGAWRSALVVAEVAMSVLVIVAAALLMQTVARLRAIDPGFRPDGVLTMSVRLPRDVQYDITRRSAFYTQLLERLDAMPRVTAAAVATAAPLTWKGGSNGLSIDGRAPQPGQSALHRQISADYFSVMGIPVRAGRVLEASDRDATLPVAVVNETMARQFWPGDDATGKRFKMGPPESPNPWLTVVGVVGDVKNIGVDAPVKPEMYLPYEQVAYNASFAPAALVVRSSGDPSDVVTSIRQAVGDLDPNQPISKVQTLGEILAAETATRGVGTSLMGAFAALSLLLAAVGLYGVVSYTVSQRLPELGLRMALGAQRMHVVRLVLSNGMWLALLGCSIGIAAALTLTRWMRSLLFQVSPSDPSTFAFVAALLIVIALAACYVPARRALKADVARLMR